MQEAITTAVVSGIVALFGAIGWAIKYAMTDIAKPHSERVDAEVKKFADIYEKHLLAEIARAEEMGKKEAQLIQTIESLAVAVRKLRDDVSSIRGELYEFHSDYDTDRGGQPNPGDGPGEQGPGDNKR